MGGVAGGGAEVEQQGGEQGPAIKRRRVATSERQARLRAVQVKLDAVANGRELLTLNDKVTRIGNSMHTLHDKVTKMGNSRLLTLNDKVTKIGNSKRSMIR